MNQLLRTSRSSRRAPVQATGYKKISHTAAYGIVAAHSSTTVRGRQHTTLSRVRLCFWDHDSDTAKGTLQQFTPSHWNSSEYRMHSADYFATTLFEKIRLGRAAGNRPSRHWEVERTPQGLDVVVTLLRRTWPRTRWPWPGGEPRLLGREPPA